MTVGPGDHTPNRDTMTVTHQRPFSALFSPVNRGLAGSFTTTRSLNQTPIDAQIFKIESDDAVVGFQADLLQCVEDPGFDPFIPAGAQGDGRAGELSDLGIRGTEYEDLDELIEDDPVGDTSAVAPQWVGINHRWDQRCELVPQRVDDR